jgi:hypothetical protein
LDDLHGWKGKQKMKELIEHLDNLIAKLDELRGSTHTDRIVELCQRDLAQNGIEND